jgi:hypothetical protein
MTRKAIFTAGDVSNCHQKSYAQDLHNSGLEQASADSKLVIARISELRNNAYASAIRAADRSAQVAQ